MEAVFRASTRAARLAEEELRQGLGVLASIAVAAPLIGVLGNLAGIINSFPGFGTDIETIRSVVNGRLAQSLLPTAAGLAIGLVAHLGYRYFAGKVVKFELEMDTVTGELVSRLSRLGKQSRRI